MTAVKHPEVDETLYVPECVVRVACPQCKVKAGTPCQGARFKWLASGERRGFRYVQFAHKARQSLFQGWKQNGRPVKLPEGIFETYVEIHGPFSKRIDSKTEVQDEPVVQRPRKTKRAPKRSKRYELPERQAIEHNGVVWESYVGNDLWIWSPYTEFKDYTSVYVYDNMPFPPRVRLSFGRCNHDCESLEEAFDLAVELVVERAFLDVLNERARWRVRELERRFGELLQRQKVVPVR
jgi:hypothetical protein